MQVAFRGALPLMVSCALSVLGCSGSKGPATSPVTGMVTYKSAPVDGATVVFAAPAGGRPATAVTDAQGKYQLTTGGQQGAVPGEYKVTVTKTVMEGELPNLTQEQVNELQMKGEPVPGPVPKNLLPEKYSNIATTDLSFTVKAGANEIPIELKD